MRRTEISTFARRVAGEMEAIPEARLRALAPALRDAFKELKAELAAVIGDGKEDRFTAQNYRRALLQLRPALDNLRDLEPKMVKQLVGGHRAAEDLAHQHLVDTFKFFQEHGHPDETGFAKSLFPVPVRQAARVAETALVDFYETSARRYSESVRRDIRLQLAKSMLKGETPFQMRNRLAPKIASSIPAGDATAEALSIKWGWWAERIVRTELVHAYATEAHAQAVELAKEEPGEWMNEWVASGHDARECIDCRMADGTRVPVGEVFPHVLVARSPAHPCCMCCVLTVRKDWVA